MKNDPGSWACLSWGRLRGGMRTVFQYLKEFCEEGGGSLLPFAAKGLFLALLCGSICFQGTVAKLRPSISSPLIYTPFFGQNLVVSCEGHSAYPKSGIIYWLANGTFVDDLYSEDAVSEEPTLEKSSGNGLSLKRELVFRSFAPKDLCTKFECIVLDPSGSARKALTWETPGPSGRKDTDPAITSSARSSRGPRKKGCQEASGERTKAA
ncbi:interleukin-18-binding protein isoform X2 [Sceloporus undulatus]|uniref:interleukin-18-binding protein isoform X2 n=1 Tax=Sceloporus undulatus TaxID=8520 RepID=UPI001C4BFD00|nr:interleukin-18-binding protein isoform X2 [Sceloporus undulatus]